MIRRTTTYTCDGCGGITRDTEGWIQIDVRNVPSSGGWHPFFYDPKLTFHLCSPVCFAALAADTETLTAIAEIEK